MQRGKFLFVISILIVLLLVVFWWVILLIESLESNPISTARSIPDTTSTRNVVLKDTVKSISTPLPVSFAYLGPMKKVPQDDIKKQHIGNDSSRKNQNLSGRNKITEGAIPELTIELGEQNIQSIADRLGFVLAASTEEKLLGKIVDDTFTPIGKNELAQFSSRGRSADALDRYNEVRENVARQFGIPLYEVKLIFLVPLRVEKQWIIAQQKALNQIAISSDRIALMRGFYDSNFNVRIDEVVTKDGQIIDIQ